MLNRGAAIVSLELTASSFAGWFNRNCMRGQFPVACSMSLSSTPEDTKHPPSQFVIDEDGLKWRLCAGAAVFNSKNEVLIGERAGKPGSWQTPQGGVDGGSKMETVSGAAIRELYEEVGLKEGEHVLLEKDDGVSSGAMKCRYQTGGTGSWLEKAGFAGQELNWTIFRCCDVDLEKDPSLVCNLSGLNGEKAEFTAVRWEKLDWVVENVWEKKAKPYHVLREASIPMIKRWEERCAALDLHGKWSRDASCNIGVVEGLTARGLPKELACTEAAKPYNQLFERHVVNSGEWIVTTYADDFILPRRRLHYPIGDFVESFEGTALIFGAKDGGTIKRCCFYMAEKEADGEIAHVTVSETPLGETESSVRYLKNGDLILRRTFVHKARSGRSVSTEVFKRC